MLEGKRVVIVGGSSGIGQVVARRAIAEGAEVFIGSSQESRVSEALADLGAKADGAALNVRDEASIADFVVKAGAFDHLVYTAGDWGHRDPKEITELEQDDFAKSLAVRFTGALLVIKHGIKSLREGGSITLTDGMTAHRPRKGVPLATAMAGAVEHLVYGLAIDLAPIRVNGVCPGVTHTAIWGDGAAEQFRPLTASLPIPRLGKPEEVAEAYLYLMKAGYTTGQILRVDGGKSLI